MPPKKLKTNKNTDKVTDKKVTKNESDNESESSYEESIEESETDHEELNDDNEYDEDGNIIEQDEKKEDDQATDDEEGVIDDNDAVDDNEQEQNDNDDEQNNNEIKNDTDNIDLEECVIDDMEDDNLIERVEVPKEDRRSMPILTKFERVRIIAMRTTQLSHGAPPLVKNIDDKLPQEIAEIELQMKMIPYKIKRYLPNRTYEIWKISELM